MENYIQLGVGFIGIIGLILSSKREEFTGEKNIQIGSMNSMPKNRLKEESGYPLFLNFFPKIGTDFKLFDMIQKLKLNNNIPIWNGTYKIGSLKRNLYESKKLPVIILVPGLGESKIYANWNKSSSENIQIVDESDKFQKTSNWSCKQVQDVWTQIWPPNLDDISSGCWSNNFRLKVNENIISNMSGVNTTTKEFGTIDFANDNYMQILIESLEAVGYKKGVNLFAACYDFRTIANQDDINKWCMSLTKLIEENSYLQDNPAIIIGHDLGAVIANYFLVNSIQEWKDRFISKFISVSGTFGGCPKALRTILSGLTSVSNSEEFNNAIKTVSGLSLMLPNPNIYGNMPLIEYNQIKYTSLDIQKLIDTVCPEATLVYKISEKIRNVSMNSPNVEVHIICGTDIDTESYYKYDMSLNDEPEKNNPYYELDLPYNQKYNYPDKFIGDGTMPKFALESPIYWSKYQKQPVFFQFFTGCEHTKILSTLEPIRYILDKCNN